MNHERKLQLVSDLTAEGQAKVLVTDFDVMAQDLAKPGEDIKASMTSSRLSTLMAAMGVIIGMTDQLDLIKKVCVYNKDLPGVAMVEGPFEPELLTAGQYHQIHMTVGIVGEAGELADAICNSAAQGTELDRENVLEELGDLLFYIQGLANGMGFSLEEIMLANKVKLLGKRYANGYSDAAAQARADKPEEALAEARANDGAATVALEELEARFGVDKA